MALLFQVLYIYQLIPPPQLFDEVGATIALRYRNGDTISLTNLSNVRQLENSNLSNLTPEFVLLILHLRSSQEKVFQAGGEASAESLRQR